MCSKFGKHRAKDKQSANKVKNSGFLGAVFNECADLNHSFFDYPFQYLTSS